MTDDKQQQTKKAFGFLWHLRHAYESRVHKEKYKKWLLDRYFASKEEMYEFMRENSGKELLDAGCGSGFSALLLFGGHLNRINYTGVDISDAVEVAAERFKEENLTGTFIRDNIQTMQLDRTFDIIFSEGVIHHTSEPRETFANLLRHLADEGVIMFYVYKKKAPVREFVDDFIREKLKPLSDEEAWEHLIPLTKMGKALGDLNMEIEIEEDIDLLEIPKGKYNLQRFFYWFFMKAYYDSKFSLDEMNLYNFDWYRPLNCYRYTAEEVDEWLSRSGLKKMRMVVEEAGITVVAQKPAART